MANILYLVHRLPYPPNKGDKVRSFHLLKHLAAQHRVFLGTFVDDEEDWQYLDKLRGLCAEVHASALKPRLAKLKSLRGLLSGEALSLPFYRDAGLAAWITRLVATQKIDAVIVFSSPMAQYVEGVEGLRQLPMLVDFVDVDSAKWRDYGRAHAWPLSWLYGREGRELLAFERRSAERAACSFFVTDKEVQLFRDLTPGLQAAVEPLCNGVDAEFFSPRTDCVSPFAAGQIPLVFTGAMDYWPNADAVIWFVDQVLPRLREQWPTLHFHIVGRSPTAAVQALAGEAVSVTGTVPDVRPYLQHAAAVVAPLRLARGIQNKILEAMAMGRPVVAAGSCVQAIAATEGQELLAAVEAEDYVRQLDGLLQDAAQAARIGAAGRARVLASYSWAAHLSGIDRHLASLLPQPEQVAA
ncbi:sugar transferase (PEP-CTERM/EpsH1 system associated) [Paucibacter oligotrophus]|uniref:Sugar transferase (PEP-CTERM/EpsH1 system associated) n=1 Tax=Roseateles oligotrophus TaxID=1769250 RepID=A0A840LBU9_9BURK|nr:TIGR03087 family PEP-CTERM/XrtA system glycosyltransferase [Roseateles oligotrophus]MBB4844132.1 sugar transferase (PEP-CTERM/EpsH1 system associated) [Roseateles oligotrophus]